MVYAKYVEVIGAAIAALAPAELTFEQGLAGVAVNRRRSRGPSSRPLPGPVDHDVPVLAVRQEDQLTAIMFGYSCHTTALGGLSISGDYAGFAQLSLEESYPGSIALFVQNCGGDANPLPRIRGREEAAIHLTAMQGDCWREDGSASDRLSMMPLDGPLRVAMGQAELELQPGPTLPQVQSQVDRLTGMAKREHEHFLAQYQQLGQLPDRVDYPIQVWQFGQGLTPIGLTGETVVDYSLKFKQAYGWNTTWVCGYNNDLLSYVPSLRVLSEGGYEGTSGMHEYGHRAPYTESVEDRITDLVIQLVDEVKLGSVD